MAPVLEGELLELRRCMKETAQYREPLRSRGLRLRCQGMAAESTAHAHVGPKPSIVSTGLWCLEGPETEPARLRGEVSSGYVCGRRSARPGKSDCEPGAVLP